MTSQRLPWDDIEIPKSDLNRLLAAPNMVSPASWAVDRQGRRLFVIELLGDHSERYERDAVTVHGLEIGLHTSERPDYQQLILALESDQYADLFAVLCRSLVEELVKARTAASSVDITLSHLRRWKAFLANRYARILTNEEIRGLMAELWFLTALATTPLGPILAVNAWYGPDKVHQDFIFGKQAVEVKSLVSSDPRTVRISSENQLETTEQRLFVVVVLLAEEREDEGRSLNQMVDDTMSIVAGTDAQSLFEQKLAQIGYLPLPLYNNHVFGIAGTNAYEVKNGFPRIVRSGLPAGVVRVIYQIQMEQMESFKCDLNEALGVC